MALINNKAKDLATEDEGLGVNTKSTIQESIAITNEKWSECKVLLDSMDESELEAFIADTKGLRLNKNATVTFRLTPREYAVLLFDSMYLKRTMASLISDRLKDILPNRIKSSLDDHES